MDTALPPIEQPQPIRFLQVTIKPKLRRVNLYIEPEIYQEIAQIAKYEGLDFSEATRILINNALRYYKFKRGTFNENLPQNTKTFYCQICGELNNMRRLHRTQILNEEYQFCENCFFADKYKHFIVMLLNRI